MALLGAINYDPSSGGATATISATSAMVAFDSTNLRLTFTAPSSGRVMVRLAAAVTGTAAGTASGLPQLLAGVMDTSSVIKGRGQVRYYATGTYTTSGIIGWDALFPVTGLTGGNSYTWDAAWSCSFQGAGTGTITWGNSNGSGGRGGFCYEIYG